MNGPTQITLGRPSSLPASFNADDSLLPSTIQADRHPIVPRRRPGPAAELIFLLLLKGQDHPAHICCGVVLEVE
eukprot:scaffold8641_cov92-Amphora_coffeaeformis.AAC.3